MMKNASRLARYAGRSAFGQDHSYHTNHSYSCIASALEAYRMVAYANGTQKPVSQVVHLILLFLEETFVSTFVGRIQRWFSREPSADREVASIRGSVIYSGPLQLAVSFNGDHISPGGRQAGCVVE